VSIGPVLGVAYLQLGILYSKLGSVERGIGAYEKAIETEHNLGEAPYQLGQLTGEISEHARVENLNRTPKSKKLRQANWNASREVQQFLIVFMSQPSVGY